MAWGVKDMEEREAVPWGPQKVSLTEQTIQTSIWEYEEGSNMAM